MVVKISAKELEECLFDIKQAEKLHKDKSYENKLATASEFYNNLAELNMIDEKDYLRQSFILKEFMDISLEEIMSYNRLQDSGYVFSLNTLDIENRTIEKEEIESDKIDTLYFPQK